MITFSLAATPITCRSGDFIHLAQTVEALRGAGVPEADVLAGAKAHLAEAIDAEAERLRGLVATPGTGQAMEYQTVRDQAATVLALKPSVSPKPEDYPLLAAGIGIDTDPQSGAPAADLAGAARAVQLPATAWELYGAAIRRSRLQAKAAVRGTGTVDDARAAALAAAWPTPP